MQVKPNKIIELNHKEAIIEVVRRNGEIIRFKIDGADIPLVSRYRWFWHNGYCCTIRDGRQASLTWVLFGRPPEGHVLHHMNKDRGDNRRCNIRRITRGANNYFKKVQANRSTGRRGISKYADGSIVALIGPGGKRRSFQTKSEAIKVRECYERDMAKTLFAVPDNRVTSKQRPVNRRMKYRDAQM